MDKQTLRQYRYLIQEIEQLEADKQALADGVIGAVKYSDMPKATGNGDSTGDLAVKLSDLALEISKRLNRAISLRQAIEAALDGLEPSERVLMRARYIEGKTWEQVAVDINYEWAQMHRIHANILRKIQDDTK